jgi:hypothetical protein
VQRCPAVYVAPKTIVDIGVTTAASLNVTVVDSVASNNSQTGGGANTLPGQAATAVMLRNSVVSYNVTGISVDALGAAAILCVAHSVVTGNTFGVTVGSGGTLF